MSEEVKDVVQEQAKAPTQEQKPVEATTSQAPFKVYASEDEFKKEFQSVSSKAKFEMLKELGAKNLEEVRVRFAELEAAKSELTELTKIKAELELSRKEQVKMSEDLVLTKFGIGDDVKDEALTLAKSKLSETENSLEKAMEVVLKKFPNLAKKQDGTIPAPVTNKVGSERKPTNLSMQDAEKQRLMQRYPHLRGRI
jgi:hypothetical protein